MMNLQKSFSILFILLNLNGFGQAQTDTVDIRCQTVIAVRGLHIRSEPDRNAKVVGKVPFGELVDYESKQSFGREIVSEYLLLKRGGIDVHGNWAKVNYRGTVGYVLDSYLFYDITTQLNTEPKTDFALLYPDAACYINIYRPSELNWYGLYNDANGSHVLKKIRIHYFSVYNDAFGGKDFGVTTDNNDGLIAIFGAKKRWKEGKRKCVDLTTKDLDHAQLARYGIEKVHSNQRGLPDYYQFRNGTQVQDTRTIAPFNQIKFIGDIDGDGKLDYILRLEGETGKDVLFLSSERANNIVAPVAYYLTHYCC